ncbi:MAG: hypothetical protein OEL66_00765, partial [Desulfobulbaceae bacterium]|nr:hypothetical protein [Desulfobulbaceae bacterium]
MRPDTQSTRPPARYSFGGQFCNQQGSILIGVIVTMVVIATLGTAIVTLTTSSSYTQIGYFDAAKAYYLAESGGRYAVPLIRQEAASGGDPFEPLTGTIALLNDKTFTMANGDKFHLAITYADPIYTVESTGILRQGANTFEATQKVTFVIDVSTNPEIPIAFDGKDGKLGDSLTEISGGASIAGNKLKIDSGDGGDKSGGGGKGGGDGGGGNSGTNAELGLSWAEDGSTLPDLAETWLNSDGLLGYSIQIKANLNAGAAKEYVAGLSFRLNSATNSSYGFSLVERTTDANECTPPVPSVFCAALDNKSLYLVLWKKVGGEYSIIDYHQAIPNDGILANNGSPKAWTTLLVRVEERYITDAEGNYLDADGEITAVPENRVRENVITAYTQSPDYEDPKAYAYQRQSKGCKCDSEDCSCTIHWEYDNFNPVNWNSAGSESII